MSDQLTQRLLDRYYRSPPAQRVEINDHMSPLRVRINTSGKCVFRCITQAKGKRKWIPVGEGPAMKLAEARQRALAASATHVDQVHKRATAMRINDQTARGVLTPDTPFADVVEKYIALKAKTGMKVKGQRSYRNQIRRGFHYINERPRLCDINRGVVQSVIDMYRERGQDTAASAFARHVIAVHNWALSYELVDVVNWRLLKRPSKTYRQRGLTLEQLAALYIALERLVASHPDNWRYGYWGQMLMLTGQRCGEVDAMARDAVNRNGEWIIERTKTGRPQRITLPTQAREVLKRALECRMRALGKHNPYVFPSTEDPEKPLPETKSKVKARVQRELAAMHVTVNDWRFADFRGAVFSQLLEMGKPLHIAQLVLNHRLSEHGSADVHYESAQYREPIAKALQEWADHLTRAVAQERDRLRFPNL